MAKPTTDPRPPERERRKVSRRGLLARQPPPGAAAVPSRAGPARRCARGAGRGGDRRRRRLPRRGIEGGHGGGNNGPSFRQGATVDHARTGSTRQDAARLRLGKDAAPRRPRAARVDAGRNGQGDRGSSGCALPGVGLQRARAGARPCVPTRATGCGSAWSTAPSTRTRSTSTASIRPRWTRSPGSAPG